MELTRFAELLTHQLECIVDLSPPQVSALYAHFELLVKWNKRINLTSLRSPEEIVIRHYCESIFFGSHLPGARDETRILDLGSGAGFPGVPMAALRPEWHVTLAESHQRKAVFLRESTRSLHNISVVARRAESIEDRFDWIVARAVRLGDVLGQIPRLSSHVGLLIGEGGLAELQSRSGIEWDEPVRVSWGEHRLCVYGKCSTWNHKTLGST